MKQIPKIYEALAKDYLKPTMEHALITKEDIVASDAHILVWHKTCDFFESDFINSLPDGGILVNKTALMDLSYKNVESVKYFHTRDQRIKMLIVTHRLTSYETTERYFKVYLNQKGDKFKVAYPKWKTVWPEDKDVESVKNIGLNGVILKRLCSAMGTDGLHFTFHGKDKAMTVENPKSDYPEAKGLIMPMMFD